MGTLGKGGFGTVFKVRNRIDDGIYALKKIKMKCQPSKIKKTLREVKVLAKLDHLNICRYYNAWVEPFSEETFPNIKHNNEDSSSETYSSKGEDSYNDPNKKALVRYCENNPAQEFLRKNFTQSTQTSNFFVLNILMHMYEEETLQDWLNRSDRQINVQENLKFLRQIFQGLSNFKQFNFIFSKFLKYKDYIHMNGFVHRDIKPSNIFKTKEGVIKIGDFGLVKDIKEVEEKVDFESGSSPSVHTSNIGTHSYASPEQLSGCIYDFKTDIYSCGLLFFGIYYSII